MGTNVRKYRNHFAHVVPLLTMGCKRLNYFILCWSPNFVHFAKVPIFVSTCAEDQWQTGGRTLDKNVRKSLKNQPLMISKHFLASLTSWCLKLAGGGFALG